MYIIIKHSFDSLENNIGNARYSSIVGCCEKEEEADIWIASQDSLKYEGWDNVKYPYYTKEEVRKL